MGALRQYGDELALVTVARPGATTDVVVTSLAVATRRPVRVVIAEVGPPGGSGDVQVDAETIERARTAADHEIVRIPEDIGRAAAANRAIAGLDPAVGWVVVAGPQIEWAPGALDVLLTAADAMPRAAALGPRLRLPSGLVLPSAGPLPSLGPLLRGRIPVPRLAGGRVGWVAGAAMLLRRAAWDSVDGFDPRYCADGDGPAGLVDVDLGDRLTRAGWVAVHVPTAVATVHGPVQGILEGNDPGLRRYVRDRYPAPVRALAALVPAGRRDR